jgi:hypothetical protein
MELKKNNIIPLTILPIPSPNVTFKSNTLNVSNPIIDNSLNYTHKGIYTVTTSSCGNNNSQGYRVFNPINPNYYWQCNYANNKDYANLNPQPGYPVYTQNPYTNSATGNSAYQGGGSSSTKWATSISSQNTSPLLGEWVQIQIPTEIPAYLFSYSILTPIPIGTTMTFPTKFVVLGSEDGQTWNYLDQQFMSTLKDTSDQMPVVFNLNSTGSYHYFRLVISEMPPNNSVVRITHFGIKIMPVVTINRDAFTNMDDFQGVKYFNLKDSHNSFIDYKHSQPLPDSKIENYMLENGVFENKKKSYNDSSILLPGILVSILAISIIFYSTKVK